MGRGPANYENGVFTLDNGRKVDMRRFRLAVDVAMRCGMDAAPGVFRPLASYIPFGFGALRCDKLQQEVYLEGEQVQLRGYYIHAFNPRYHSVRQDRSNGTILYLHGGGLIVGSAFGYKTVGAMLCNATGYNVLLVEYRLGPEAQFPENVKDAVAGYQYLLREKRESADRIIIMGDSAGGGLTVLTLNALLGAARYPRGVRPGTFVLKRALPRPKAAVLNSPWLDFTCNPVPGSSMHKYWKVSGRGKGEPFLSNGSMSMGREFARAMVPIGATLEDVSPCNVDTTGFPPVFVSASSIETLRDEAVLFADKLRRQNPDVPGIVGLELYHQAPHVCAKLPGISATAAEECTRYGHDVVRFVRTGALPMSSQRSADVQEEIVKRRARL